MASKSTAKAELARATSGRETKPKVGEIKDFSPTKRGGSPLRVTGRTIKGRGKYGG